MALQVSPALGLPPALILAYLGVAAVVSFALYVLIDALRYKSIPSIEVALSDDETAEVHGGQRYVPTSAPPKDKIPCYDPSTMQLLGYTKAMSAAEVKEAISRAKQASKVWRHSSFKQRRLLLEVLLKYIITHQEDICRVSARDSGKTPLEAVMGEIIVTAEKLRWLINDGEQVLKPQQRGAGVMAFYKAARVEYIPVGVVGAIVPWNWPFHNIINPISAAVMAGNAIVIKVSEHASWSIGYYSRLVNAALAAAGAPAGLVEFVTGYGEAGHALVTGCVDKVVFVGSTEVGKKVMAAASEHLTPVTLELGGKDAFIVCEDADLKQVVPIAVKAAFLNCGQNCASGERFIVHSKIYDKFVEAVKETAAAMRQGPTLGQGPMDAGAMCMPGSVAKVQRLVDDAVSKGAQVIIGGSPGPANYTTSSSTITSSSAKQPTQPAAAPAPAAVAAAGDEEAAGASGGWLRFGRSSSSKGKQGAAAVSAGAAAGGGGGGQVAAVQEEAIGGGQFYPPTVLVGVTKEMLIYREEVFGPVMTVYPFTTDDEAVAIANDCDFGLGSSVFSGNVKRARAIASRLEAGMSSINDFNATYMCQGLPFGGVKYSGFGRFGGVEGLRALCVPKAVAEDRLPWLMKTTIPAPWLHPVGPIAQPFAVALTTMFYGPSLLLKLQAMVGLAKLFLLPAKSSSAAGGGADKKSSKGAGKSKGSKKKKS